MQDKYTGLSGSYVLDSETGERLTVADYEALQVERAAAIVVLSASAPLPTPEPDPVPTKKRANNGTV